MQKEGEMVKKSFKIKEVNTLVFTSTSKLPLADSEWGHYYYYQSHDWVINEQPESEHYHATLINRGGSVESGWREAGCGASSVTGSLTFVSETLRGRAEVTTGKHHGKRWTSLSANSDCFPGIALWPTDLLPYKDNVTPRSTTWPPSPNEVSALRSISLSKKTLNNSADIVVVSSHGDRG